MSKKAETPTMARLLQLKLQFKGAKRGHDLLKKKSDALSAKFRLIKRTYEIAREQLAEDLTDATFSMTQLKFAGVDLTPSVEKIVAPSTGMKVWNESVAGVYIPEFELEDLGDTQVTMTGLHKGGQRVKTCREKYAKTLATLLEVAKLMDQYKKLDEAVRVTNRRVNALEYIVLPRIQDSIDFIRNELDELERESFFRLKKVQDNNIRKDEIARQKARDVSGCQLGDPGSKRLKKKRLKE